MPCAHFAVRNSVASYTKRNCKAIRKSAYTFRSCYVRALLRLVSSGGSKNFEKWGRRKTIYQLRPHLSQMRTTKYAFYTKKADFDKNMCQQAAS